MTEGVSGGENGPVKNNKPHNLQAVVILLTVIAVIIAAGVVLGLQFYPKQKRGPDKAVTGKQKYKMEVLDLIAKLADSKEMKPCPLIFPILEKNRLTPLGSYISYLAMIKASNVPEAPMSLPDVGSLFNSFRLFDPETYPIQSACKSQLPLRFKSKSFCDATMEKGRDGYDILLRFYGEKQNKFFRKQFGPKELHKVPEWLAQCAWEYEGNRAYKEQLEYFSRSYFTRDENLIECAGLEYILRSWPGIACGVEKMHAAEPENPVIKSALIRIYYARGEEGYFKLFNSNTGSDDNGVFREEIINSEIATQNVFGSSSALTIINLIMNDNNNAYLYQSAVKSLKKGNYNSEAGELFKMWCKLHPENQDAWIGLSENRREYPVGVGWDTWGRSYKDFTAQKYRSITGPRVAESEGAARRAVKVAPQDSLTWNNLLRAGIFSGFSRKDELDYFNRSISLNNMDAEPYLAYYDYIRPQWHGSDDETAGFCEQYFVKCPLLPLKEAADGFWESAPIEGNENQLRPKSADGIEKSGGFEAYVKNAPVYFSTNLLDRGNWAEYFRWMYRTGKREQALAMAKKIIPHDPQLAGLYPKLVLMATDKYMNGTPASPEADIKLEVQALKAMVKADKYDWEAWNQLAKLYLEQGKKKEAKKCFKAIGDNYNFGVWTQEKFLQAKATLEQ